MVAADAFTAADPRTQRLRTLWGYRGTGQGGAILTPSAAEARRFGNAAQGAAAYLHSESAEGRVPLYRQGSLVSRKPGGDLVGYIWDAPDAAGLRRGLVQYSTKQDSVDPLLGYAYLRPATGTDIHSQVQTVTVGTNVLRFNLAAGGYLESWKVSGTEILNRADSWGRGHQEMLEWVDVVSGELRGHHAAAAASRFQTGVTAQGAIHVQTTIEAPSLGGTKITVESIPIELDPDGSWSVPGVSTDHGGGENTPILWDGFRVATTYWINYQGTTNLHLIDTTWTLPFSVTSAFFDLGMTSALHLDGRFNEIYAYNALTDTLTNVSVAVDAVDWRRWSVTNTTTFEDEQASPTSASTIASAFGGMIGRESGPDLAVGYGGRMHTVSGADPLDLASVPRGTNVTYMTNRTGATGYDGDQAVVLGLDGLLSGRWHGHDITRTFTSGTARLARFVAIDSLANVRSLLQQIPATY